MGRRVGVDNMGDKIEWGLGWIKWKGGIKLGRGNRMGKMGGCMRWKGGVRCRGGVGCMRCRRGDG